MERNHSLEFLPLLSWLITEKTPFTQLKCIVCVDFCGHVISLARFFFRALAGRQPPFAKTQQDLNSEKLT